MFLKNNEADGYIISTSLSSLQQYLNDSEVSKRAWGG